MLVFDRTFFDDGLNPPSGALRSEEYVKQNTEMVRIPSGRVLLGATSDQLDRVVSEYSKYPRDWYGDELPQRPVEVSAFLIDRYPVTNRGFYRFAEEVGYKTLAEQQGWGHVYGEEFWEQRKGACWRDPIGDGSGISDRLDHPVVHISHLDAEHYCAWSGKRLVTEIEWERVAKGSGNILWPWGDQWNERHAWVAESWANRPITSLAEWKEVWKFAIAADGGRPRTRVVYEGEVSASPFGVVDLCGNVNEVTGSIYSLYGDGPYDPLYQAIARNGRSVTLRGGAWTNFRWQARTTERMTCMKNFTNFTIGFRCAADV